MLGLIFYCKKLELISLIILATCPYNSLKIPMKLCNWLQVVRVAILMIQDDFGQKSNLLEIRQTFCPCLLFYFQGYGGLLCFLFADFFILSFSGGGKTSQVIAN
jgi:hypothetical protein